jgi:hypothetical protein
MFDPLASAVGDLARSRAFYAAVCCAGSHEIGR